MQKKINLKKQRVLALVLSLWYGHVSTQVYQFKAKKFYNIGQSLKMKPLAAIDSVDDCAIGNGSIDIIYYFLITSDSFTVKQHILYNFICYRA